LEKQVKGFLRKSEDLYNGFMFENILGNELVKTYLERGLQEGILAQTLLFTGPEGVGKALFAETLAGHLLRKKNSPDLHLLAPEGKSGLYAIDTIREMIEKEHAAPFEGPGKVFILKDVDRMQPASANALLKTLEEPSPDTTFILISSHPKEMLPTILSRCSILNFQPLPEVAVTTLLHQAGHPPHFAKYAQGSIGRALDLATLKEIDEERVALFRILEKKPSYPELMQSLEKIETVIESIKEEDPVKAHRRVELLFSYVLMWHRDQHVKSLGKGELAFFETPEAAALPLIEVEKAIERARTAYLRNMKLSHCLLAILSN
jgi:DNA polymerase III delta prime subunit